MPASRDNRRLVTYVPVVIATEIERRARADGRTVSGWLSRLIAEALSDVDQDVEVRLPPLATPSSLVTPQAPAAAWVDKPVSPDPHTRLDVLLRDVVYRLTGEGLSWVLACAGVTGGGEWEWRNGGGRMEEGNEEAPAQLRGPLEFAWKRLD